MAVFALVGGALLFTHVHSAAPYANVAVGVYIHHTALGVVALLIGAVKLLEDARPRPGLARRLAYPALMLLEAVLLLNYNEGLPWFLGYRDFSTVAAHGGLVAPLGPDRAELVFDPLTARLQMFIERPNGAQPVRLPTQSATAIVRVGEEATEVPLRANPGGETTSAHFAATVPFLRGVPLFTTQAHVKWGGRAYTADFEPWVDPTQARHSTQPWVCPMHPWVGSSQPGVCPVAGCGMRLEANRPPRPAGVLHDPDFRMDLATDPAAPAAGRPVRVTLTLRRTADGATVRDLDTVHTKKMHLIIASRDLSFFDHVHPVQQPEGSFVIAYAFPHGGAFSLYADVTPTGAPNQVFHIPVNVSGAQPPAQPLRETPAPARLFGDYRVTLSPSPWPLVARDEATLTFSIEQNGLPVTDLEPYLGAGGHCVGLSADGADYLHSHPLQTPGAATSGPDVTFHARFPRPGLYKVWGQFQHHGRILVADFVVRVN